MGETQEHLIKKWAQHTYRTYANLFTSPDAAAAGIQQLSVFNTHSTIVVGAINTFVLLICRSIIYHSSGRTFLE